MNFADWSLFAGGLLITMVLLVSALKRLPMSSAMIYLALGWSLGPHALGVLEPNPAEHADLLERAAEIALLVSLFSVGMNLRIAEHGGQWHLPVRLAVLSMAAMVGMVSAVGFWMLSLPIGVAVLLGAILAPTDPVLAAGLHAEPGTTDRVAESLAAEGGLNDGAAFPFVMLGLGLLGLHDLGDNLNRWWSIDLVWSTAGGMAIGAALGAITGRLVVYLRTRHDEAVGLDEFLCLGLIALAYGAAQSFHASGFLAVFAAGLALQRVREQPRTASSALEISPLAQGHSYEVLATHSHHASATMRDNIRGFNGQIEKFAELALVFLVGAMLAYTQPLPAVWWFVPLLLAVLRPISSVFATVGARLTRREQAMIAWFGIRGIGSIFYLMFALRRGLPADSVDILVSLTLWSVAASIVVHGLTAHPLVTWYRRARTP